MEEGRQACPPGGEGEGELFDFGYEAAYWQRLFGDKDIINRLQAIASRPFDNRKGLLTDGAAVNIHHGKIIIEVNVPQVPVDLDLRVLR